MCFYSYCLADTAAMPVWDYELYPLAGTSIGRYQAYGLEDFYLTPSIYWGSLRAKAAVSVWLAAASELLTTLISNQSSILSG
jgi:hypothetical protein